jgi:hypothetical protein
MTDIANIQFGRIYSPDARDRQFPMRAMLPARIPLVSKFYKTGPVLDQGSTSQCVGYSWRQFLTSEPEITPGGMTATEIYREAQLNDEWPGEAYDGSSVRGGAKALSLAGCLKSYVWAGSAADVRDFLITTGTVVAGTDWKRNMMTPGLDGLLNCTGPVEGGHAYLLTGYDAVTNRFQMINSWGASWGLNGMAWITFRDLDKLLRAYGEMCAAVEQVVLPTVPTIDQLASQITGLAQRVAALEGR